MSAIDDIIATAKLPEQTVRLCIRGDLLTEHQDLDAQINALGEFNPTSLAEADPRTPLAARLTEVEQEMRAAEVPFTFRALGRRKYRELLEAHPSPTGGHFNADTFPRALIAACAVSPEITPSDADRLFDVLNDGAVELLFMAAFTANEGLTRVPFSVAASAVTRSHETR